MESGNIDYVTGVFSFTYNNATCKCVVHEISPFSLLYNVRVEIDRRHVS